MCGTAVRCPRCDAKRSETQRETESRSDAPRPSILTVDLRYMYGVQLDIVDLDASKRPELCVFFCSLPVCFWFAVLAWLFCWGWLGLVVWLFCFAGDKEA